MEVTQSNKSFKEQSLQVTGFEGFSFLKVYQAIIVYSINTVTDKNGIPL